MEQSALDKEGMTLILCTNKHKLGGGKLLFKTCILRGRDEVRRNRI